MSCRSSFRKARVWLKLLCFPSKFLDCVLNNLVTSKKVVKVLRTASASGLTPFSIRDTHSESCARSSCVFYVENVSPGVETDGRTKEALTRRMEISSNMSTTSRAFSRFSSLVGMLSASKFVFGPNKALLSFDN